MLYATSTRIIAYAASMSYRGWLVSIVLSALTYLYNASTLSHPRYNSPCVRFGAVMRVLYGLFATDFAHYLEFFAAMQRTATAPKALGEDEKIEIEKLVSQSMESHVNYGFWDKVELIQSPPTPEVEEEEEPSPKRLKLDVE